MSKDQRIYLRDILERIERIEQLTSEGEAVFYTNYVYQDAIIRSFEVIGEIVKRLDDQLLTLRPEARWEDYAGFRDILIHQYDKVILRIVWEGSTRDLPKLRAAVEHLLAYLG